MISYLHGDHVWPYSLFGETTWDNYQLICGDCNLNKSNRLDIDVRKALGADEFRQRVRDFLREQVDRGALAEDVVVRSLLGHVVVGAVEDGRGASFRADEVGGASLSGSSETGA